MNEVRNGLEQLARMHDRDDKSTHPLDAVAQNWSEHAGRTYTGKLLKKAQKISAAMWDFTATLQRVNPAQHECDMELGSPPRGDLRCPRCGADVRYRERRPDGNDHCYAGCVFPSSEAIEG